VDEWQLFVGADLDSLQLNSFFNPAGKVRGKTSTLLSVYVVANISSTYFAHMTADYPKWGAGV
jgi:hypothetical protein